MRTQTSLLLVVAALGACNWTSFDDLQKTTWVESSTKSGDIKSAEYALSVARGEMSPGIDAAMAAGKLVVVGGDTPTLSELSYDPTGAVTIPKTTVLDLQTAFGIQTITADPLIIADPTSDDTSLILGTSNGIALLTGNTGDYKLYQLFNTTEPEPDAATFMLAPTEGKELPLVGIGDTVVGAQLPALPANALQPMCKLADSATAGFSAQIRALGTARNGGADDVLMWDAGGKLYKYPGSVFDGCNATGAEPTASLDTSFMPDVGSQIVTIDASHVLLQGHSGTTGTLLEVDTTSMTAVGSAVSVPGVASAAVLTTSSLTFAVAGVPTASDGGTAGGQVQLYEISGTGVGASSVAAYNDAQPESDQEFGRAVAIMPYNGDNVIAVAAKNEVFTYFRANLADGTPLYDETRQGH